MKTATVNTQIKKQKDNAFSKEIYLLGIDSDGVKYWLEAPTWDCGWCWGFGYVETFTNNNHPSRSKDIDSHQHIKSSFLGEQDYYDSEKGCFRKGDYISNIFDSPKLAAKTFTKDEGWELTELFNQFYFLQDAAENFGRGKCNTADTSIKSWKDEVLTYKINKELIPMVTARILEILSPSK
jgi:hypothetical protein